MSRPNIIVIMADQLAPQFTGTYGHPVVKTPHLDALAARGARFDAAYCNSPLCAPARFSFMSGQLVTKIGAYDNAAEFAASTPTLAHYLRLLRYRTCLSGKMHFVGPDQLHGFEERLTTDVYPSDHAWTPDWDHADQRIDKWYHNMDSVKEAGTAASTFQLEYDEEVAFATKRKIFDYAKTGESFALVASFIHPHDPYVARPEFWDLYDHDDIDMPTTPEAHDAHSERVRVGIEAADVSVTPDQVRNARHAYYANTSYVDAKIGEIVQTLREAELLDNTVVIVTGDHGDMLGEHGLWYKMTMLEHSVRVPLVMAGPGVANHIVTEPCSLVDLLPTMLDIAAGAGELPGMGAALDGRSLWPVAQGLTSEDPDATAIAEYCAECASHPIFMVRRGPYKYIACEVDAPLLFNVVDDPMEQHNLTDRPEHQELATAFAAEVGARWDSSAIRDDVLASQRRRRVVAAAMQQGMRTDWDYQPHSDATEQYVRNHMDWTVAAATTRFPPFDGQRPRS